MTHREEAQGTAQDTLEGLCLSAGLGTPWASPGGAGGGVWGEGRLGVSAESAAPATRSRISGRRRRPGGTSEDLFLASTIFYGVMCWSSSLSTAERKQLDKLIRKLKYRQKVPGPDCLVSVLTYSGW
ncbi:hypothetical protein AMECASPLE_018994 [Ameca splendens]|uniref:Uncharacterized protein n=1 Tax=Ameca splendens TaxID=208324 RepID=A0ABV0XRU2_9TELE